MPTTDVDVCNAALTRIGKSPISSLDDVSLAGQIAKANYEQIVRNELSSYPWRFASKTLQLSAIAGEPDPPWGYAYQLPTDLYFLRTLKVGGARIDYEKQYDKVLCDVSTDDELIAHYTWRVPEADWPGFFVTLIACRLEPVFLRGLGERHEEAEPADKRAEIQFRRAKAADAQSQTPVDPTRHVVLEARRGTG